MRGQPFWERAYREDSVDPFGPASAEVLDLLVTLRSGSSVLDLGCGAGRHALACSRAGMMVTGVDVSPVACSRLRTAAADIRDRLQVIQEDISRFKFTRQYDVVIAHGVLHLLPRADRVEILTRIQSYTVPGGTNVVAIFTNRLPSPPDLEAVTLGLFDEGELFRAYLGWDIILQRAYTMCDEHPGGVRHEHPVNKIVARKPKALEE